MKVRKVTVGTHVLGELHGCPKRVLERKEAVRRIVLSVVKDAKLNALGDVFHQFKPYGVTGIVLLAESHVSIHTWPEKNVAAIDVFTCGKEGDARKAFKLLSERFEAEKVDRKIIDR
jgi:S-adenosylmethionine decarboxylase